MTGYLRTKRVVPMNRMSPDAWKDPKTTEAKATPQAVHDKHQPRIISCHHATNVPTERSFLTLKSFSMQSVVFKGPLQVALEERPRPQIKDSTDVIVKVRYTALCGR